MPRRRATNGSGHKGQHHLGGEAASARAASTLDTASPVRDAKGQVYLRASWVIPVSGLSRRRKQQALFEARQAKDFPS
jgi:hypothetical protein